MQSFPQPNYGKYILYIYIYIYVPPFTKVLNIFIMHLLLRKGN
uniref:Uncharacterized protein n=1 Tax=Anguilla anguilla TaxID=7936 RepID=A0A0E9WDT3_ANGAN